MSWERDKQELFIWVSLRLRIVFFLASEVVLTEPINLFNNPFFAFHCDLVMY